MTLYQNPHLNSILQPKQRFESIHCRYSSRQPHCLPTLLCAKRGIKQALLNLVLENLA